MTVLTHGTDRVCLVYPEHMLTPQITSSQRPAARDYPPGCGSCVMGGACSKPSGYHGAGALFRTVAGMVPWRTRFPWELQSTPQSSAPSTGWDYIHRAPDSQWTGSGHPKLPTAPCVIHCVRHATSRCDYALLQPRMVTHPILVESPDDALRGSNRILVEPFYSTAWELTPNRQSPTR